MLDGLPKDPSGARAPSLPPELMVWLSPAFPIGSFAYSQGLEQAAERQWVKDRASLADWIAASLTQGALRTDLVLLAEAWRAALDRDEARLHATNGLACAPQPSAERHLETTLQGNAFRTAIASAWPDPREMPGRDGLMAALGADVAYPVAVAVAAASRGFALDSTLMAYALAAVTNATSAAIRLSVIGQTDAQRITADLMTRLVDAVRAAATTTPDDLGSATFAADIASLAHETQYTRLFRS